MSNPDSRRPIGIIAVEGFLLLTTWAPTLFVLLAGDAEAVPLFASASGALDIVFLALFKDISS